MVMTQKNSLLRISAASWVLEIRKAEIDRIMVERSLPPGIFVRRMKRRYVQREGLAYLKFALVEEKKLSPRFRKEVLRKMSAENCFRWEDEILTIDLTPLRTKIEGRLRRLQRAESTVVEKSTILGGEPCIKGTRMPVYMVAAMIDAGATIEDLVRNYPSLSASLIESACAFASAYPRRGRLTGPSWRKFPPERRAIVPKRST
jgi:uncharacterized protein (DUF433 family)